MEVCCMMRDGVENIDFVDERKKIPRLAIK